jgi:3-oxosteroid 1-dehydrogenase
LAPEGSGPGLGKGLNAGATEKGVEILTETPAKELIQDAETGGILGVVAESEGKRINIKARLGVIMAAGGFPWNEEMVKHYLRGPSMPTSTPGNTGDGILMGMAVGADLRNMNEEWGMPVAKTSETAVSGLGSPGTWMLCASWVTGMPGAIVVNKYGKRFYDEAGPYDTVKRAYDAYDPTVAPQYTGVHYCRR